MAAALVAPPCLAPTPLLSTPAVAGLGGASRLDQLLSKNARISGQSQVRHRVHREGVSRPESGWTSC